MTLERVITMMRKKKKMADPTDVSGSVNNKKSRRLHDLGCCCCCCCCWSSCTDLASSTSLGIHCCCESARSSEVFCFKPSKGDIRALRSLVADPAKRIVPSSLAIPENSNAIVEKRWNEHCVIVSTTNTNGIRRFFSKKEKI
jgi:hypothetical protein